MHIRRAPDFLVATARLLTHGVGSSTWASTPNFTYLSNSSLSFVLRAVGTLRGGIITGLALSSVSRCTVPGSDPTSRSKISAYSWTIFSVEVSWWTSGWDGLVGEAVMKFELFILINFICWAARAPISGVNVSRTTTNSIEYLLWFFGLRTITRVEPTGVTFVPFHMCSDFFDGLISQVPIYLSGKMFTDAPQSTWNDSELPFIIISA